MSRTSILSTLSVSSAIIVFLIATPSGAFQSPKQQGKLQTKQTASKQAVATEAAAASSDPKPGTVKVNSVDNLRYVWVPPGKFRSGCSQGDKQCYDDEWPTREITLTRGFWLAETEVPQSAYDKLMGDDPSVFRGPTLPVEMTTWIEADAYCKKIGGRLPTEMEWEWAARGGTASARYGKIDDIAWYLNNSNYKTHPVGTKMPNVYGLYDMLGNVVEWTNTYYTVQHSQENINPQGPSTAEYRSLRGGGWWDEPDLIRVTYRRHFENSDYDYNIGFRCVSE